jgi:serine/threonine protein kinase
MYEVFESEKNIHLVLEYIQGGELYEKIKQNGTYEELEAALMMKALFTGL